MKNFDNKSVRLAIKIVIPLLIAVLSIFVVGKYATSISSYSYSIKSLDEKKTTVMELTAASTAASAAITLLPGDTATPIATKLADLSSYFLVVLCAIYLEKYLLTMTGYATFYFLIPIACGLYVLNLFVKNPSLHYLTKRLVVFGIAIVVAVPASVRVSDVIDRTYQSSVDQMIEDAKSTTEEIEGSADSDSEEEEKGLWGKVTDAIDNATVNVSNAVEKVQTVLNDFIEALAVLIVTSCVIPVITLLFFIWLFRVVFGVDIQTTKKKVMPGVRRKEWER